MQVRGVSSDLKTNATILATKLYSTLDKLCGTRKMLLMNEEDYPTSIKNIYKESNTMEFFLPWEQIEVLAYTHILLSEFLD